MIVVSDTSPVTNLYQIGRLELLREVFAEVVVPAAVAHEIKRLDRNLPILTENNWLKVVELSNPVLFEDLKETLDAGEAEAIALAVELSADALLIDEQQGRREAVRLGLNVTGIVGVLIKAKEKGLIPAVRPEIAKLVEDAGFWLDPDFIVEVLRSANEK